MGTFAYGASTRRRVLSALADLRTFQGNERHGQDQGLTGLAGPYRRMLGTRYGALPTPYALHLDAAEYVVYCYGTPIAWVTNPDGAQFEGDRPRTNYLPDWQYSATTTYYQGLVRQAWGDKIVNPSPQQTAREMRDKRDRVNAQRRANRRSFRDDSALVAVVGPDPDAYPRPERQFTRAQLLDPRLADPDWVPGRTGQDRMDMTAAERRDLERVRAEGRTADRYPHP